MAECNECGSQVAPGENFCGNCGSQTPPVSSELKTVMGTMPSDTAAPEPAEEVAASQPVEQPDELPVEQPVESAQLQPVEDPVENIVEEPVEVVPRPTEAVAAVETPVPKEPSAPISSTSLDVVSTDDVKVVGTSAAARRGTTGGRQPGVKQLEAATVLNGRYEIVRRIGGGGMGAVYLAKDRNLGDAPRAVKEMIESHLDPTQHEKAIGDFKRESLLLTSLEHPSIPTIYDYFYDDGSGRFYLVLK
jgi:hypothetical protein